MTYKTFTLWVSFDNGTSSKDFHVVAVSAQAAFQDIKEAFGDCLLISQNTGV